MLGGGIDFVTGERIEDEHQHVAATPRRRPSRVGLVLAPLMHGAAQWGTLGGLIRGTTSVLLPQFDAARRVGRGRRAQDRHDRHHRRRHGHPAHRRAAGAATYDTSSLVAIASTAAVFSPVVKDQLFELLPNLFISEAVGSSEGGFNGMRLVEKGKTARPTGSSTSRPGPTRSSSTSDASRCSPARSGCWPAAATCPSSTTRTPRRARPRSSRSTASGSRCPATRPASSSTARSRCSAGARSASTRAARRSSPKRSSRRSRRHPKVFDALVVGVADERWGQRVAAVVQARPGEPPTLDELVEHCRTKIAGLQGAAGAAPRRRDAAPPERQARLPPGQGPRRARSTAMKNRLTEMFGIEFPIFAFSHCRDVVAAVTNAGGMGVLGALAFTDEQLELELNWIDEHVDGKPYGVDVVMPVKTIDRERGPRRRRQGPRRAAPGDDPPGALGLRRQDPRATTASTRRARRRRRADGRRDGLGAGVLGLDRGHRRAADRHRARRTPIALLASALGPPPQGGHRPGPRPGREGRRAHRPGRAGRARRRRGRRHHHRPGLRGRRPHRRGGDDGALPDVVDAIAPVPVLAAGGIGSGRQMAAAMALGADGVWTGSIWLTVIENESGPVITEKLLAATSTDTVRSRSLTGKPARMLRTGWTEAWEAPESPGPLPMPLQFLLNAYANRKMGAPPAEGARRHAGRPDRQPHEQRPHDQAGRPRDGRGVHRRHHRRWPPTSKTRNPSRWFSRRCTYRSVLEPSRERAYSGVAAKVRPMARSWSVAPPRANSMALAAMK